MWVMGMLAQTMHGRVVVGAYGVNQSTCTEEQQRLKHSVSEQMEHTGHVTDAVVELGRATPSETIMNAICDIVENASTRLMSICVQATIAA